MSDKSSDILAMQVLKRASLLARSFDTSTLVKSITVEGKIRTFIADREDVQGLEEFAKANDIVEAEASLIGNAVAFENRLNKATACMEKGEKLKGGLADGKTVKDLATMHKLSTPQMMALVKHGVAVELEHTSETDKAKEVAMDHLYEDADYYKKLKKIEKSFVDVKFALDTVEKAHAEGLCEESIVHGARLKFDELKKACESKGMDIDKIIARETIELIKADIVFKKTGKEIAEACEQKIATIESTVGDVSNKIPELIEKAGYEPDELPYEATSNPACELQCKVYSWRVRNQANKSEDAMKAIDEYNSLVNQLYRAYNIVSELKLIKDNIDQKKSYDLSLYQMQQMGFK